MKQSRFSAVMIETVILDYGGVISPVRRSQAFVDWLLAHYAVSAHDLHSLFEGPLYRDYQRGVVCEEVFYGRLRALGVDASPAELAAVFNRFNEPDSEMKRVIDALRPDFDLCLISDSTPELTRDVKRRFAGVFRVACFSDDHGCVKSDERLFDVALRGIAKPGDVCLYIDDRARNLAYPASVGIHCILFTGMAPLIRDLHQRYGIDVRPVQV